MPGHLLGGRYRLQSVIGQGGMSLVWRAVQEDLERAVVVKVLRREQLGSEEAKRRAAREARVSGRLIHPNIVVLLDAGATEGAPFLVFEHLQGETLRDRLTRQGALPIPTATRLLRQIAHALLVAHEADVVHRDIKPGNVFLVDDRVGGETVKVLDFGLARTVSKASDDSTSASVLLGTAAYMSPEIIEGGSGGPSSDLYALGVVAYEAITGKNPFRCDSPLKSLMRHVEHKPPPLEQQQPVPPALGALVDALLAKDPSKRPASAREVYARLADSDDGARVVGSAPVAAPAPVAPPSVVEGSAAGASRRLLIIDDDEVFGELMRQRLELAGFSVDVQPGPFGSLHAIRTGVYDAVLLDVNMPGLAGTKILDLLPPEEPRPKVLLVSSMDERSLAELASRHGADGYVPKGAARADLVQTVTELLAA